MTIKKNKKAAKLRALEKQNAEIVKMEQFLEKKWSKKIHYNCVNCLEIAYKSTLNNETGYVTDEELIELSNGKLLHK